jgi:DnaJ-class molecular chaperone
MAKTKKCKHCKGTGKHFGSMHPCTFCLGKKVIVEKESSKIEAIKEKIKPSKKGK